MRRLQGHVARHNGRRLLHLTIWQILLTELRVGSFDVLLGAGAFLAFAKRALPVIIFTAAELHILT